MKNSKASRSKSGSKEEIPDELRCRRNDGKFWRCSNPAIEGRALCHKHYKGQRLTPSAKKKGPVHRLGAKKIEVSEEPTTQKKQGIRGRPRINPIKPTEREPTIQKKKGTRDRPRLNAIRPNEKEPRTQKRNVATKSETPGGEEGLRRRGRKRKQEERQAIPMKPKAKEEEEAEEEEPETPRSSEKSGEALENSDAESGSESDTGSDSDTRSESESDSELPPRKKLRLEGAKCHDVRGLDMRWKPVMKDSRMKPCGGKLMDSSQQQHPNSVKKFLPNGLMEIHVNFNECR